MFFDARGQDRVLRVTWHEGTLVLSLWRGEMCTASFRMPMDDVGRLIDTLDDGFTEAGGQYADEPGTGPLNQVEVGEYPGTGQYTRPQLSEPPAQGYPAQPGQGGYGAPGQGAVPYQQEQQAPAYAQAGPDAGYGQPDGDYRTPDGGYGHPDAAYPDTAYPDAGYPDAGYGQQDGGYPQAGPDYGRTASDYGQPDPDYGQPVPYQQEPAPAALGPNDVLVARGTPGRERRGASSGDSVPRENLIVADSLPYEPAPGSYGQYETGQYETGPYDRDRYERDQYDRDQQYDQGARSYDAPSGPGDSSGGSYDPGEPVYQFPSPVPGRPAYRFDPEPQPQQGQHPSPQQGQQGQQGHPHPQSPQQSAQSPHAGVDPNDPLGLGTAQSRQTDPSLTRPYIHDPVFSTGERLRPEQRDERDW
ncbi:hypothetical protein Misp02_10500 [Microtetraspora sp. NBRC 16547]|nr:hypothetical protein Misp02_10500 [Microtetraspora sp. NBRC 16547]